MRNIKQHYKMYKHGKSWIVAGLIGLSVATTSIGNLEVISASDNSTFQSKSISDGLDYSIKKDGLTYSLDNITVDKTQKYSSVSITLVGNFDLSVDGYESSQPDYKVTKDSSENVNNYSLIFSSSQDADTIEKVLNKVKIINNASTEGNITVNISKEAISKYVDTEGKSHYYQYVPVSTTWLDAYNQAKNSTFRGLHGYLATITSQEEQDFIYNSIANRGGWLGGTRATLSDGSKINNQSSLSTDSNNFNINYDWTNHSNGVYYWADGPEAGTVFYNTPNAGGDVSGVYSNFNNGEPNNNSSNEAFLQFAFSGFGADPRKWNDLRNNANEVDSSWAGLEGYYVEYSEFNGDSNGTETDDGDSFSKTSSLKVSNDKPVIDAKDQTYKIGDNIDPLKDVKGTDTEDGSTKVTVAKIVDKDGNEVNAIPNDQTGSYTVTYTTTDQDGNTTTATKTITVVSNDKPVIDAKDQTYKIGDNIDPLKDVKGTDTEDGSTKVTVAKIVDKDGNEVNAIPNDQTGSYTVTYTTTDQDGNTTTATKTITVVSNDKPVIDAKDQTYKIGDNIDPLKDVKGTDTEDGSTKVTVAKIVDKDGNEVNAIPNDQTGSYTVTYMVTDQDGNTTTATKTITVQEADKPVTPSNNKPVIIPGDNITIKSGDSLDPTTGMSASDTEDGNLTSKVQTTITDKNGQVVTAEQASQTPGSYEITYTVTDQDGNTTTATKTITVQEADKPVTPSNNKPVIIPGDNITIKSGDSLDPTTGMSASDTEDGNLTSKVQTTITDKNGQVVTAEQASQTPGSYEITYTVTDQDGNTTTATKTITVQEADKPVTPSNNKPVIIPGDNNNNTRKKTTKQTPELPKTAINEQIRKVGIINTLMGVIIGSSLMLISFKKNKKKYFK